MSIIIILWLLYFILKAIYRKPAKKTFYSLPKSTTSFVCKPDPRRKEVDYRQQEKLIRQQEKQRIAEEKQLQKEQTAENDMIFLKGRIDQLYSLLWDLDDEITETEKQIEIDNLMRSYDKMKKKIGKKNQLIKKRLAIENQIHATENRINKAKYILNRVA